MQDLKSIIKERRSIRDFQEKEVPDELLQQILECVRWAPSWANTQCWEVIVLKARAGKERLRETLPEMNPARSAVMQAPVVLALCGKLETSGYYKDKVTTKFGDWFMFDLGIATQTICLSAHDLGLATVIVGLFDHNRARDILKVSQGHELVALIPLGYAAKDSASPKRREVGEFTHYETFVTH
ncbi:MAG: nitroreductase family protein [Thermodesulfobacteriota bacterium]|nr:nitroreductase family protein [Thermodesulfobacteriota bacterium]